MQSVVYLGTQSGRLSAISTNFDDKLKKTVSNFTALIQPKIFPNAMFVVEQKEEKTTMRCIQIKHIGDSNAGATSEIKGEHYE